MVKNRLIAILSNTFVDVFQFVLLKLLIVGQQQFLLFPVFSDMLAQIAPSLWPMERLCCFNISVV